MLVVENSRKAYLNMSRNDSIVNLMKVSKGDRNDSVLLNLSSVNDVRSAVDIVDESAIFTGIVVLSNDDSSKILYSTGVARGSGKIYITSSFVIIGYQEGDAGFVIYYGEPQLFARISMGMPCKTALTAFSQYLGSLPKAVSYYDGFCLESFSNDDAILRADYAVISDGYVREVYGFRASGIGFDVMPTTRKGAFVSLLSSARSLSEQVELPADWGILIDSSIQGEFEKLRRGAKVDFDNVKKFMRVPSEATKRIFAPYFTKCILADSTLPDSFLIKEENVVMGAFLNDVVNIWRSQDGLQAEKIANASVFFNFMTAVDEALLAEFSTHLEVVRQELLQNAVRCQNEKLKSWYNEVLDFFEGKTYSVNDGFNEVVGLKYTVPVIHLLATSDVEELESNLIKFTKYFASVLNDDLNAVDHARLEEKSERIEDELRTISAATSAFRETYERGDWHDQAESGYGRGRHDFFFPFLWWNTKVTYGTFSPESEEAVPLINENYNLIEYLKNSATVYKADGTIGSGNGLARTHVRLEDCLILGNRVDLKLRCIVHPSDGIFVNASEGPLIRCLSESLKAGLREKFPNAIFIGADLVTSYRCLTTDQVVPSREVSRGGSADNCQVRVISERRDKWHFPMDDYLINPAGDVRPFDGWATAAQWALALLLIPASTGSRRWAETVGNAFTRTQKGYAMVAGSIYEFSLNVSIPLHLEEDNATSVVETILGHLNTDVANALGLWTLSYFKEQLSSAEPDSVDLLATDGARLVSYENARLFGYVADQLELSERTLSLLNDIGEEIPLTSEELIHLKARIKNLSLVKEGHNAPLWYGTPSPTEFETSQQVLAAYGDFV